MFSLGWNHLHILLFFSQFDQRAFYSWLLVHPCARGCDRHFHMPGKLIVDQIQGRAARHKPALDWIWINKWKWRRTLGLQRDKGKEVGLNNKKKTKTKEKHRIDHKGMRRRRRSCGSAAVQPVLTAPAGGEPPAQQTGTHLFPKHPSGLRSSRISALTTHHFTCFPAACSPCLLPHCSARKQKQGLFSVWLGSDVTFRTAAGFILLLSLGWRWRISWCAVWLHPSGAGQKLAFILTLIIFFSWTPVKPN